MLILPHGKLRADFAHTALLTCTADAYRGAKGTECPAQAHSQAVRMLQSGPGLTEDSVSMLLFSVYTPLFTLLLECSLKTRIDRIFYHKRSTKGSSTYKVRSQG